MVEVEKVDASSPWLEHYRKVEKVFLSDDDVIVSYDDDSKTVTVRVKGTDKAEALAKYVRPEIDCGNVTLHVNVVPDNEEKSTAEMLQIAFSGIDMFAGVAEEAVYGGTITYAVFEPEIVQFWNDNIGSPFGVKTMTAEQVAKDVFQLDDALICSDLKDD